MNFNGINEVMQRISDIENRFGVHANQTQSPKSFQTMLQGEIQSGQAASSPAQAVHSPTSSKPGAAAASSTDAMLQASARKYNVDPRLVSAVADAESGYHQSAVSDAGAVGVMQLMPDTAEALGVNPYDEAQNIDGGTKYLKQLLDSFGGDVTKAVAAYNAGSQAVRDYNGVPPYRETQNYVNKVLDLYR